MATITPHRLRNVQPSSNAMDADALLESSYRFDLPFNLDQLRTLKAIVAEGSFRRAAERLYVSQPSISTQVRCLERQFGFPLFNRGGGRQVQLTEAGHLLLSYGNRILTLCQEACQAIENLQNLQGGMLIAGASQTIGTYLMPHLIGLFRQKHPKVGVQLHVHSTRQICWSVANGQVSLAIVEGEVPCELQEILKIIPYTEDELVLVLPHCHPFAQRETIQKEDLYTLPFIGLDSQSTVSKVIGEALVQGGIDTRCLKVAVELSSIEALKNSVQAGLGAAFVSTLAIEKELQLGLLHRVKVENVVLKRVVSVIFNPTCYLSKAAETFSQEILSHLATLEAAKASLRAIDLPAFEA